MNNKENRKVANEVGVDSLEEQITHDAPYWYKKLFSADSTSAQKLATAQQIWDSIKTDPKEPAGRMTLAALSQGILEGVDFTDPQDRRAFFEFMESNDTFRKLFNYILFTHTTDNSHDKVQRDLSDLSPLKDGEEIEHLAQVGLPQPGKNTLHKKILDAMETDNDFVKELFEFTPSLLSELSDDVLVSLSFRYPGVVAAALLGYEKGLNYLDAVIQRDEVKHMLAKPLRRVVPDVDTNGAVQRAKEYDLRDLYLEQRSDPAALLGQINQVAVDQRLVLPVSKWIANTLTYFKRTRFVECRNVIQKIADGHFVAEDRELYTELRYRLYQPATIKAMESFWWDNIGDFIAAAGPEDEYLAHLLMHMSDPVEFVRRLLCEDARDYMLPRLAKVMPVLGKIPGHQAKKARNTRLLNVKLRIDEDTLKSVKVLFQEQVNDLIEAYGKNFNDPGDQLLAVLEDDVSRGKCWLSSEQVGILLRSNPLDPSNRVNSRFEVIIASRDDLWRHIEPIADDDVDKKLRYPYLAARSELRRDIKQHGSLLAYINSVDTHNETLLASIKKDPSERETQMQNYQRNAKQISIRKAYLIASNKTLWAQLDPYALHPLLSFLHWMMPNWQPLRNFFQKEEDKLAELNPIFQLRLDYRRAALSEKKTVLSFEQYLVRGLGDYLWDEVPGIDDAQDQYGVSAEAPAELGELLADIGRGDDLMETFMDGSNFLLQTKVAVKMALGSFTNAKSSARMGASEQAVLECENVRLPWKYAEFLMILAVGLEKLRDMKRGKAAVSTNDDIDRMLTAFMTPDSDEESSSSDESSSAKFIKEMLSPELGDIPALLNNPLQSEADLFERLARIRQYIDRIGSRLNSGNFDEPISYPTSLPGLAARILTLATTVRGIAESAEDKIGDMQNVDASASVSLQGPFSRNPLNILDDPFDHAVLGNPYRLEAFLAQVNTPEKVELVHDFIVGAVDKLTPEQVHRFMKIDECPTLEQENAGRTCHQLAEHLILAKPQLLNDIVLDAKLSFKLPNVIKVIVAVLGKMPDVNTLDTKVLCKLLHVERPRSLSVLRVIQNNIGLLRRIVSDEAPLRSVQDDGARISEGDLAAILESQFIRANLTADDLLRIKRICRPVFCQLMEADNRQHLKLREKFLPRAKKQDPMDSAMQFAAQDAQLLQENFSGLSVLSNGAPECLGNVVSECLFETLARMSVEDINNFSAAHEGDVHGFSAYHPRHPLYSYMMQLDVKSPVILDLMLRCMQGQYKALAELMRDVLLQKLAADLKDSGHELLTAVLMHDQCHSGMIDFIATADGQLNSGFSKILCDSHYVETYLSPDADESFSNNAQILWSKLLGASKVSALYAKLLDDPLLLSRLDKHANRDLHWAYLEYAAWYQEMHPNENANGVPGSQQEATGDDVKDDARAWINKRAAASQPAVSLSTYPNRLPLHQVVLVTAASAEKALLPENGMKDSAVVINN